MSYLLDLNKKYERYKTVLRERNRLKDLEREIRRKFPTYESFVTNETLQSIESLNEMLHKPVEKELKLYLNHSNTYSFEQKKAKSKEKIMASKNSMKNYIENLTRQHFDGVAFLQEEKEKDLKIKKNKLNNLKKIKKKVRSQLELVENKLEEKHRYGKQREDEEYLEKIRKIEESNKNIENRVLKEKGVILEKIENQMKKRGKLSEIVKKNRFYLDLKDSVNIEKKLNNLFEQSILWEKKKENLEFKNSKNIIAHETKLKKIKENFETKEKEEENKKIQSYMENFQKRYEEGQKKREEIYKQIKAKNVLEEKTAFQNVSYNREKMLERQRKKEEYFKEKLKNDSEKIKRAQNIREFIRRKTEFELEEKLYKMHENKEEQDYLFRQKTDFLMLKEEEAKRKLDMVKKEIDFVVEERRDYNTKLSNYRNAKALKVKI